MYKILLCWRYLLTRYLALACIISVMLGVATLIVVNGVMEGFSSKLRERLHGLLSDVVIEANSLDGFPDPDGKMERIKKDPFLRDRIVAMTPTMEVFAMLQFNFRGQQITRTVRVIGIDPKTRAKVGGFKEHLRLQKNENVPSFEMTEEARKNYLWRNPLSNPAEMQTNRIVPLGKVVFPEGGEEPEAKFDLSPVLPNDCDGQELEELQVPPVQELPGALKPNGPALVPPPPAAGQENKQDDKMPAQVLPALILKAPPPVVHKNENGGKQQQDKFSLPDAPPGVQVPPIAAGNAGPAPKPKAPPSRMKMPRGIIVGHLIANIRSKAKKEGEFYKEIKLLDLGDDVVLTTVSGGKLAPVYDQFVVVDFFQSEMSEYDSNYVFVPLDYLQHLRSAEDRVTSIQIKLKDFDKDAEAVVKKLEAIFPPGMYKVDTWEGKQGPLLAAIQIERGILNVLLFLIICVAGFGILAIFSMIVTEKTRDIGIMKALGASNNGVLSIFLGYGLLLGVVGASLGTVLGVSLTNNINEVERFLTWATGHKVFDREVYYFDKIPTMIQPTAVLLLNLGSIAIAVLFSVLPAYRASRLHPVRALRYE